MPVLCIERERGAKIDTEALTKELLEIARTHEHTHGIDTVLYHPSFPVDVRHHAQIFREKLPVWAGQQRASPAAAEHPGRGGPQRKRRTCEADTRPARS